MKLLECIMFGMLAYIITGARCKRIEVLAAAGSQAVLPCACGPSPCPNPRILWTKGTQDHKQTVWRRSSSGLEHFGSRWMKKNTPRVRCPHYHFLRGDLSLQINTVREDDGGLYTCQVELGSQLVLSEVMLRIIEVSVNPPSPISGSLVLVSCSVTPRLDAASVEWKLNNSSFVPQKGLINGKWGFVKGKAMMNLTGNWTCVVRSDAAEGRASTSLSVRGIIRPSGDDSRLYAAVGSAATLPCFFSPSLKPSNSSWEKLKEGTPVKPAVDRLPPSFLSPSSSPTHLPGDKSATLSEVTSEDKGTYRCSGTVAGQRLARTVQLVVAKIVLVRRGSSVALTCHLSDASEVTDYEWVRVTYDHNGTESVDLIREGETLSIGEESREDGGEWTCRFYGERGILGNVTYTAEFMSGLRGQKSSNVSANTTAILVFCFLLLVLLLILVQMYKNNQRRKRIFQFPALETIVHTVSNEQEERERNRQKK